MDTIEPILQAVREHYLTAYRRAIAGYRQRFATSDSEVLLEMPGVRPLVYRYYRMDLASGAVDPPNFTEVNTSTHLDFTQVRVEHEELVVLLSPLTWNGVEFQIRPPLANDAAVQLWALRWIDPEERAKGEADGLGTYVHSITPSESQANHSHLSIDFGSAPVTSLLEFLIILNESGAREVWMHSSKAIGQKHAPQ